MGKPPSRFCSALYEQQRQQSAGGGEAPGAGFGGGDSAGTQAGAQGNGPDDVVDAEIIDEDNKK